VPMTVSAYTPKVAPGVYDAVCTDQVVKVSPKDGAEFRIWEFTTTDGQVVTGSSSMLTSQGSKGGKWLAALLGAVPAEGDTVEPVGRPCQIVVELNENGYERVTGVLPRKASATSRKPIAETALEGTDPANDLPF
jgi:hypothetical protein